MNKKLLILGAVIAITLTWYLSTDREDYSTLEPNKSLDISSFERAQIWKESDPLREYKETITDLARWYPDQDPLLTKAEIMELFPELWIDEEITCYATHGYSFRNERQDIFDDSEQNYITGNIIKPEDKLFLEISSPDTLNFVTSALLSLNKTEGSNLEIVVNNPTTLIASDVESETFMDTITISKTTGNAVWQSVNAAGVPMSGDLPEAEMYYLKCDVTDKYDY